MSYQGGAYYQQPRSAAQLGSQYAQQQQQAQTSSSNDVSGDQETSTTTTTTTTFYLAGYQQQAAQAQVQQPTYRQQVLQDYQPQYQLQITQPPQYQPAPQQQLVYQQQPSQYAHQVQSRQIQQAPAPPPQLPPPPKPKGNYDHLKTKAPRHQPTAKPSTSTITTTTKKQKAVQTTGGTAQAAADQRGEGQQFQQRVLYMLTNLGICPRGFNWFPCAKGWLCGGGTHGIKHSEIDEWAKDPQYQPKLVHVNAFDPFEVNAQGYPMSRLWCPPNLADPIAGVVMHTVHRMHIQAMLAAGRGMKKENQCECAKAAGVLTKDQENALTAQMSQGMGGINGLGGGMSGFGF